MTRILYIRNPAANGANPAAWEEFQLQWPDPIESEDIQIAERLGHAREIAASVEGYDILVAVGGDGTVREVLPGIIEHQAPRPKLAIVPAGTADRVADYLGISCAEDAVTALRTQHTRMFDVCRIDSQVNGRPACTYTVTASNVGFPAVFLSKRRNWMKRLLGNDGANYCCRFVGAATYRPPHMTVRWNGQEFCDRAWKVRVSNAGWVEKVERGRTIPAPRACGQDGELDVSVVPFRSKSRTLLTMPKAVSGSGINHRKALYFGTRHLTVDSEPSVSLEVDGDLFGTTPATFTSLPKAIHIVTPS